MYLAPFKIFTISKNKRLLDPNSMNPIGIYDVTKYNFKDVCEVAAEKDCMISILLGKVYSDVKLMCLDLDDCFDESTGEMEELTKEFLKEFDVDEYEISSSGTGIHIYILTKLDLETFIVKELEGCKSFECYTNKRHIVTTLFDFENTNLQIGKHDKFIQDLYDKVRKIKEEPNQFTKDVKEVFGAKEIKTEQDFNSIYYNRTPVTDMYTLRGLGYKDPQIIEVIDQNPDSVDQSAWDAKLIRKLMYYCLSFDAAHQMAKKTNYYKAKDQRHKKKFDDPKYIERTRRFIGGGRV